ncbi:MAG: CpaE family protein [Slackia sp.]
MEEKILACMDSEAAKNPSLIGLAGESLASLPWLACETKAEECRGRARAQGGFDEAWVISCDDMEAINVAAAIRHDGLCGKVFLIADGQNGSLASRATNAGIDGLWSEAAFVRRYAKAKASFSASAYGGGEAPDRLLPASHRRDCGVETVHGAEQDACGGSPCEHAAGAGRQKMPTQGGGALLPSERAQHLASSDCAGESAPASHASSSPVDRPCANRADSGRGALLPLADGSKNVEPCTREAQRRAYEAKGAPTKEGPATVVAVVGGSGGCGKSTLSALLALMASRSGLRTAAFDADLQFGDLDYLLGIPSPLRIEEVCEDPSRLSGATCAHDAPFLVAAPRRLEVSELVAAEVAPMISALKRSFDAVVVNTGAMWADGHAAVLKRPTPLFVMDEAVFLAGHGACGGTLRAARHRDDGFLFVVNRYEKTSLLTAVDASCALHGARVVELADGGRDVDELLGAGYPDELLGSKNAFVEGVREILTEVLPERRAEALRGQKGVLKRRRSLFGRGGVK